MDSYHSLIQIQYLHSGSDHTALFQAILSAAREIGLDQALAYLEECSTQKRLAWLEANAARLDRSANPLLDGYRLFYQLYLGISTPADGEIVAQDERRLVMRWWNPCPTLNACQQLGLDTREICRKAYHRPVEAFLRRIDPRLRFERNYEALRPYTPYCEEIIRLVE
jgi:tRNA(adenine34) deaminase